MDAYLLMPMYMWYMKNPYLIILELHKVENGKKRSDSNIYYTDV